MILVTLTDLTCSVLPSEQKAAREMERQEVAEEIKYLGTPYRYIQGLSGSSVLRIKVIHTHVDVEKQGLRDLQYMCTYGVHHFDSGNFETLKPWKFSRKEMKSWQCFIYGSTPLII